jgi:hypothetical protein
VDGQLRMRVKDGSERRENGQPIGKHQGREGSAVTNSSVLEQRARKWKGNRSKAVAGRRTRRKQPRSES